MAKTKMTAKIQTVKFKMPIGSPTNQERTHLCGKGVFVGNHKELLVHCLPIYRQKDYPNYQTKKTGPWVVALAKSGLRISATAEKLVFLKLSEAVEFATNIGPLLYMYAFPIMSDDPRTLLEIAKDKKDEVYARPSGEDGPLKVLAKVDGATFIQPQR